MPFVVHENDYHLMLEILESLEGTKVVVSVEPGVRKANRTDDVEVFIFFLGVSAISSHVKQEHILLLQLKNVLQRWLFLPIFSKTEQVLSEITKLFLWKGSQRSFVNSDLVG
jgi:hypothetical protein